MQYNTHRGIFGPRGRGGGVFSPALKGLGATALGGWCWDTPGFKDCHAEAGHQANRDCVSKGISPGSPGYKECWEAGIRANTNASCVPRICGGSKSSGGGGGAFSFLTKGGEDEFPSDSGDGFFSNLTSTHYVLGAGILCALAGGTILFLNRKNL